MHVDQLASVAPRNGMRRPHEIAFLGRFEEPRKGFPILLEAFTQLCQEIPDLRLVVAGPGDSDAAMKDVAPEVVARIEFLGRVSEEEKAAMLAGAGVYVAPNTGGESFGIVLLEAMACHTPVVASNLPAFLRVLDYGNAGILFENENVDSLVIALREILKDEKRRDELSVSGFERVQEFDWGRVASDIINVYETVTATSGIVEEDLRGQIVGRLAGD